MSAADQTNEIEILDYLPTHSGYFKLLNQAWITRYFELEELDHLTLNNPDAYIISKGGHILMASWRGQIVGTCALIRISDTEYELAKMAVAEQVQGRQIGYQLGQATIAKAWELGAQKLTLLSNRQLAPALHLYRKLGFAEVPLPRSGYKRADIKMELVLAAGR